MALKSWDIELASRIHTITVEPTENNKEMIRLNGRTVAKPLTPDESEREFRIEGAVYAVRRTHDGYELEERTPLTGNASPFVEVEMAAMRPPGLASLLENIRLSRLLWIAIVAIVGFTLWWAVGPNYEKAAAQRVELLLAEMSLGPGPQEDLAIGIWARNARTLDSQELAWAVGKFPDFRRAKDLRRKFTEWKVVQSEEIEGADVATAIVTIEVEGKRFQMLVPERRPISWVN
jgi:hypothetical protein